MCISFLCVYVYVFNASVLDALLGQASSVARNKAIKKNTRMKIVEKKIEERADFSGARKNPKEHNAPRRRRCARRRVRVFFSSFKYAKVGESMSNDVYVIFERKKNKKYTVGSSLYIEERRKGVWCVCVFLWAAARGYENIVSRCSKR